MRVTLGIKERGERTRLKIYAVWEKALCFMGAKINKKSLFGKRRSQHEYLIKAPSTLLSHGLRTLSRHVRKGPGISSVRSRCSWWIIGQRVICAPFQPLTVSSFAGHRWCQFVAVIYGHASLKRRWRFRQKRILTIQHLIALLGVLANQTRLKGPKRFRLAAGKYLPDNSLCIRLKYFWLPKCWQIVLQINGLIRCNLADKWLLFAALFARKDFACRWDGSKVNFWDGKF